MEEPKEAKNAVAFHLKSTE